MFKRRKLLVYTKNISAAVLAVRAGNDMIVTSTFKEHIDELIEAVNKGEVDMELIESFHSSKDEIKLTKKFDLKSEKDNIKNMDLEELKYRNRLWVNFYNNRKHYGL